MARGWDCFGGRARACATSNRSGHYGCGEHPVIVYNEIIVVVLPGRKSPLFILFINPDTRRLYRFGDGTFPVGEDRERRNAGVGRTAAICTEAHSDRLWRPPRSGQLRRPNSHLGTAIRKEWQNQKTFRFFSSDILDSPGVYQNRKPPWKRRGATVIRTDVTSHLHFSRPLSQSNLQLSAHTSGSIHCCLPVCRNSKISVTQINIINKTVLKNDWKLPDFKTIITFTRFDIEKISPTLRSIFFFFSLSRIIYRRYVSSSGEYSMPVTIHNIIAYH